MWYFNENSIVQIGLQISVSQFTLANKNISVWDQLMSDTSTHVIPLNCLQKPPRCVKYVESN